MQKARGGFRGALLVLLFLSGYPVGAHSKEPQFATLDEIRIHYQSYGVGEEAVVFVHGGMGNLKRWEKQVPEFQSHARLILLDLPGHGQSDKPKISYSVDLFARSIAAVLQASGVKRAVLVGMSFGTPIIRHFYRRYPQQTLGLVFVDGPLKALAPTQEIGERLVDEFRSPDYLKAAEQFLETFIFKPTTPEENRRMEIANWSATPQHVMVSVLEQTMLPNAAPEIWRPDPIGVPVLAIYTKNPYVAANNEKFLRSFVTDLDYQVIESSHNIVMERAADFNRLLLAFLRQHRWAR